MEVFREQGRVVDAAARRIRSLARLTCVCLASPASESSSAASSATSLSCLCESRPSRWGSIRSDSADYRLLATGDAMRREWSVAPRRRARAAASRRTSAS